MTHRALVWLLLPSLIGVSACGGEDVGDEELELETPELPPVAPQAEPTAQWPDTTAEAVWAYLQEENYQSWPMWPGKSALYSGTEPHGMLLTTYVNPVAQDALGSGGGTLPDHSIVVKENYMPDSTLAAVTVMYKAPGYDPEHNDWWWLKRNADGSVDGAGRVEGCIGCHGGRSDNDYIMTEDLAAVR